MSDVVIRVENLGKKYIIGHEHGVKSGMLRDRIAGGLRRLFSANGHGRASKEEFWALKDVSFEVNRGDVVGIIGRNGAGKSTLLKILSRITEPTVGNFEIRGRVGSLLEVGTGFHPELSGRENVYLNGAILGMTHSETKRRFDEIVTFAEVERFIDTPVKHYSTGMQMRLAFAIAAHLEAEVLIVDEVLAVGDAGFQKKCLGKMEGLNAEGRTVLFVSHNMMAVQRLCNPALWLQDGSVRSVGSALEITLSYLGELATVSTERTWAELATAPGNKFVKIKTARVRPLRYADDKTITMETPIQVEFEYWNLEEGQTLNLSVHLYNENDVLVFNTTTLNEKQWHGKRFHVGLYRSNFCVPSDLLNSGFYRIELLFVRDERFVIFQQDHLLTFQVCGDIKRTGSYYEKWAGVIHPQIEWQTQFLETDEIV